MDTDTRDDGSTDTTKDAGKYEQATLIHADIRAATGDRSPEQGRVVGSSKTEGTLRLRYVPRYPGSGPCESSAEI